METGRCAEFVSGSGTWGAFHSHQCNRKNGYGPEGKYCKIHDPEYIKRKNEELLRKYEIKRQNSPLAQLDRIVKQRDELLIAAKETVKRLEAWGPSSLKDFGLDKLKDVVEKIGSK